MWGRVDTIAFLGYIGWRSRNIRFRFFFVRCCLVFVGSMVVFPVAFAVSIVRVSPTNSGTETMIFALFVS